VELLRVVLTFYVHLLASEHRLQLVLVEVLSEDVVICLDRVLTHKHSEVVEAGGIHVGVGRLEAFVTSEVVVEGALEHPFTCENIPGCQAADLLLQFLVFFIRNRIEGISILTNSNIVIDVLLSDERHLVHMETRDQVHLRVTLDVGQALDLVSVVDPALNSNLSELQPHSLVLVLATKLSLV